MKPKNVRQLLNSVRIDFDPKLYIIINQKNNRLKSYDNLADITQYQRDKSLKAYTYNLFHDILTIYVE